MPIERITQLPEAPKRADNAHKGSFGRVLLIGGNRGMSGAISLAALGALRGGAGLVYVAVPESIVSIVATIEPSYLVIPLKDDDAGRITFDAKEQISDAATRMNAVAIGPGLGLSNDVSETVRWAYQSIELPMVVDADALNVLAGSSESLPACGSPRILTPHPGEFARLTNRSIGDIQNNREHLAAQFAEQHGVILLLKGHRTIITDGKRLAVNETGNNGMATGGSGDVLTGLIASLLAQGMEAFESAQLAAHVHGLAGDLTAEELSKPGLIASDLPLFIGHAWKRLCE